MSNVIAFLEKMGNNAALAQQAPQDYAAAVQALDVDHASRQALLDRDPSALNALLGGRLKMMCFLLPADGEEPQKDEQTPDGDGETPGQDDKKESIHRNAMH